MSVARLDRNAVAHAVHSQTPPNTASVLGPQTNPPLAVFQQLAQASNAGAIGTVPPAQRNPVPVSVVPALAPTNVPPVAPPSGAPAQNLPFRDDRNGFTRREPQFDRHNGPHRGRDPYDHRDQRGGFRGRGRGRGRWDERDHQFERNRGGDWNAPPGRNYHSRSRSPTGRNGRHLRPPPSPPRKQPFYQSPSSPPRSAPPVRADGDKDEFGRDLRPAADTDSPASAHPPELSPSRSASIPVEDSPATYQDGEAAPTSAPQPPPPQDAIPTVALGPTGGLDSVDLTSFNPTEAASWAALAQAWNVSNGYMPSESELMGYIMSMNAPETFPIQSSYDEGSAGQWTGDREDGWGRGHQRQRGRGQRGSFGRGYDRGNGRGDYRGRGRGWDQDTDALTLAGGDEPTPSTQSDAQDHSDPYGGQQYHVDHSSGQMQRSGGKWVFVKGDAAEVA